MPTLTKPLAPELDAILHRLQTGGALLPDSPTNVVEVVGILKSYGVVLDAYWRNLTYIADHQFLELFPIFKYFNGNISADKLRHHLNHDRLNYEFAEYCMRAMFYHGGGKIDAFLDSPQFVQLAEQSIQAKIRFNPLARLLHRLFPTFLIEQVRLMVYYSALGQFWSVMAPIFLILSDRYDRGEITTIPQVVNHVLSGLVDAAQQPIVYQVTIDRQIWDILPQSVGATFLMDTAVPYVEAVFFRSFPFRGTVSYNAQAQQISRTLSDFNYGALYADPLPVGGGGIPPTLLFQDLGHYIPDYLHSIYLQGKRQEGDIRVQMCASFQKSMFCVTTAAILGLAPFPIDTPLETEQEANRQYLTEWLLRLKSSRLLTLQG